MFSLFAAHSFSKDQCKYARPNVVSAKDTLFEHYCTYGWRNPSSSGAVIFVNAKSTEKNVNLEKCMFNYNNANLGGACYLSDAFTVIHGCTFMKNIAEKMGGALVSIRGTISLDDTIFLGNYVSANHGAAVIISPYLTAQINSCYFNQNQAGMSSGALAVMEGDVIIKDTVFSENTAGFSSETDIYTKKDSAGGALWLQGGSENEYLCFADGVVFDNNRVIDNKHKGLDIVLCGLISFNISNSKVITNAFRTLSVLNFDTQETDSTISMQEFDEDYPKGFPSKIYFGELAGTKDDSPWERGEEIESVPMLPEVINAKAIKLFEPVEPVDKIVKEISHKIGTTEKSERVNKVSVAYKASIYAKFTIFDNCISFGQGIVNTVGDSSGGAISAFNSNVELYSCNFTNNVARRGGAIFASSTSFFMNDMSVINVIQNNKAHNDGSAVYIEFSNISITNAVFNQNSNIGDKESFAIQLRSCSGSIHGVSFRDNNGGSILLLGKQNENQVTHISNSCFAVTDEENIKGYDIKTVDAYISLVRGYLCSNRNVGASIFNYTSEFIEIDAYSALFGEACTVCKFSLSENGDEQNSGGIVDEKKESGIGLVGIIFIVIGTFIIIIIVSVVFYIIKNSRNNQETSSYEYYSEETKTMSKSSNIAVSKPEEDVPAISLRNPMCTISMEASSDSIFDDLDLTDDVGEI